MTRTSLSPAQQVRAQQIHAAHTNMKQLEEATAEALKYHDKYLDAMEKVMTCLLNSSDTWEDVRTHIGTESRTMDAIAPSGGRLAAAYNTLKVSKELRVLRDQLQGLHIISKSGRQHTKKAKSHLEKMETAARKCAEVNSHEYESKIAQRTGKAKDKLVKEKHEQDALMESLDKTVMNDLKSTGAWWSVKLVSTCDELYNSFVMLGRRTLACFSDGEPSQPISRISPAATPQAMPGSFAATPIANRSLPRVAMAGTGYAGESPHAGLYNPATTASGVPLQFESVPRNLNAL